MGETDQGRVSVRVSVRVVGTDGKGLEEQGIYRCSVKTKREGKGKRKRHENCTNFYQEQLRCERWP